MTATLAAGLAVGLAVAAWSGPGMADDFRRQRSTASAVRSRSVQRDRKLKWLPYRPSMPRAAGRAVALERAPQTAARTSVRTARRPQGTAFEDPFEDARTNVARPTLAAVAGEDLPGGSLPGTSLSENGMPVSSPLEEPPAEPGPGDSRPAFPLQQSPAAPPDANPDQLRLPTPDRPLPQDEVEPTEPCPLPRDPEYHKRISELSTDISAEEGELPRECTLTEETIRPFALGKVRKNALGEPWTPTTFTWKASALCHKPLYFEEVHLERYGQSWGPFLQPLASGAHFFLTVPALPYKMGIYPPCECMYTLGYYRPGSCAPRMLDPLPLSVRAALAEGGVWTGMVFLIP